MKRTLSILMSFCLVLLTLSSCKQKKEEGPEGKINMEEVEAVTEQIEETVYPLPTSAELINMINDIGINYMVGITNEAEKADEYMTSKSKALNVGIYGADLSYVTIYQMQQEVLDYLEAIRELSKDLNLEAIYDEALYEKIKQNFDSRDELIDMLTDTFNKTYSYLTENDQQNLALMVVAGGWVEGMYITTHVNRTTHSFNEVVRVFLEQKKSFELYLELAQPYAEDPMVKEVLEIFEPLKVIYSGMDGGITEKQVDQLEKAIEVVRAKLVS